MKIYSFKGGIHPPEAKHYTNNKKIETAPIPKIVVIPLSQHTGAPAKLIVNIKDKVKAGTKIGELQGKISSNIHSSISGIIKSIEKRITPTGIVSDCVIVENDGTDEYEYIQTKDINALSRDEIINIVKETGIVGLGGAAFPTYVKLSPPQDKPVNTVILNGAECEPYLTADYRLMLENPEEILIGGSLIAKALDAKKCYIGIENNKPEAIKKIKEIVSKYNFELFVLKTKYPQGEEKQLIKAITKKEVPSGGLPFDVGVCVQNVGTAFAVYEACKYGKPLIERIVTLTGAIKEPKNLKVRIGTLIKDLIEFCGGYTGEVQKIIMGGPMMGIAQPSAEMPIIKGTSGILIQNKVSLPKDEPCIKCGFCVEVCPLGLLPGKIADYISNDRFEEAKDLGLFDCRECGSCAYVCPSKRNLVHLFKYGKIKAK